MEIVILKALHMDKSALRISSVYDDEGDPAAHRVYRGEKLNGDRYIFELAGEHTLLSAALRQFTEELKRIMGV